MLEGGDRRSAFAAFRYPSYTAYSVACAAAFTGSWMQRTTIGWVTWELTGSGAWLGLMAFADLFPTVALSPIAGAAADRWNKLRILQATQWAGLALMSILWSLSVAGLLRTDLLLLLTALLGSTYAFGQPAQLSIINSLVPRNDLSSAVALNSVNFNLARFAGPALAGVLIAGVGVPASFGANMLGFVAALVALSFVQLAASDPALPGRPNFATSIMQGLRYTCQHTGIGAMMLLMIAVGLGGRPVIELLPGYAGGVFGSDAMGLAALSSAMGFGAVFGGLWVAQRGRLNGLTSLALSQTLLFCLSVMVFSAANQLWMGVLILIVGGFALASSSVAAQTLIQSATDPAMRGRVMSLFGIVFRGGPALGALLMGLASAQLGLRWPVFIGIWLVMAVCLWAYLRRKRIAPVLEARYVPSARD